MGLVQRIVEKKAEILRIWHQKALKGFPVQSRLLIASNTDRFANPIGFTLQDSIGEIFAFLFSDGTAEKMEESLSRLVKLRAVQDPGSNEGVEFLLVLKMVVRDQCGASSAKFTEHAELREIEDQIDQILVKAHRIFVDSRELIAELKVNEMRRKTHGLRKIGECS